jgi:hypothetical protein
MASARDASSGGDMAVRNYLLEHLYIAARERAYKLADTGRFRAWPQLAEALALEGHGKTEVERLAGDRVVQVLLTLRILVGETHE